MYEFFICNEKITEEEARSFCDWTYPGYFEERIRRFEAMGNAVNSIKYKDGMTIKRIS